MTPQEITALITMTVGNFPHMQEKELHPTALLWQELLSDLPFDRAKVALVKVLCTAKFWPTVAEIRQAALQMAAPPLPTASEAWGIVKKAISKFGSSRPGEALESLPPLVAKIVREIGWREICLSEKPDVLRGQFRQAYEVALARENEMALLPEKVRDMVGAQGRPLQGLIQIGV